MNSPFIFLKKKLCLQGENLKSKVMKIRLVTLIILFLLFSCKEQQKKSVSGLSYEAVKKELKSGWGSFNTRDFMSFVMMPQGLEVSFDVKYQATNYGGYLERALFTGGKEWRAPKIRPVAHQYDAGYTKMEIDWKDVHIVAEAAAKGDDLVVLFRPSGENKHPSSVVVSFGMLWNKPGVLKKEDSLLMAELPDKKVKLFPACKPENDYNVSSKTPYLVLGINQESGFSIGSKRNLSEIKQLIEEKKSEYEKQLSSYNDSMADAYQAITTCMAWNTIYEPVHDRVVSTVSRPWNVKRGGYSFFGWDNFFLAYLASLNNKELAFANVIEHLNDMTEEGFIPNCSQGNERKTWDRSQPPVGGIMVKEIYKKYPEKWFIQQVFHKLLRWNRWWMERRYYKGLLCWGSHESKNPFHDGRYHDLGAAMLESGIDDSPMYEGIPFNKEANVMELHDVGLNSLYVADCMALAEMAGLLGKDKEAQELVERAEMIRDKMKERLWSDSDGIFYNRRTDNDEFHKRLSPTLFYPLMANVPTQEQAERMIREHFYDTNEFWGEWVLPSISRNDPTFKEQKYWKGAIWAPMNFLVYLSLREYELPKAAKDLSQKSLKLFVKEWNRKHFVSENYSSITGTGDDERIKSDRFYTWGALLGIIPFIEEGIMPAPEESVK